jgi:hypothetical protein
MLKSAELLNENLHNIKEILEYKKKWYYKIDIKFYF